MSKNIEVEVRSFIDDQQFENIKKMLDADYVFVTELKEVTVYFSGEKDLRMRKNETEAYVILKEGKIHDDFRKEFEIGIQREDFDSMVALLESLGYAIEIEWHRSRREYAGDGIKILLDDTQGYGKILELERMVEPGQEAAAHHLLVGELGKFGIGTMTSKEEFNAKYEYYKKNWQQLIR